ncbi:MAG: hypothetical protein AAGF71_08295 [Pseudomonadota bacterium]
MPLRSSLSKGRTKHYAYYLCQTKGCDHYGKSLEPTPGLVQMATAMFRSPWDGRAAQANELRQGAARQIRAIDAEIEALVKRLTKTDNHRVISAMETTLEKLERDRAIAVEQSEKQCLPRGTFEEKLEPALHFFATPWKLWETGDVALRRVMLKVAFPGRLK